MTRQGKLCFLSRCCGVTVIRKRKEGEREKESDKTGSPYLSCGKLLLPQNTSWKTAGLFHSSSPLPPFSPLFSSRLTPRSVFSVAFCLTFSIISYILLLNRFRGTSLCYGFPVLKLSTCFSTLQACLSHLLPGLSCICFPVFLSFSLNLSFYPLIWWA